MRILLKKAVEKLGNIGDIVDVKDGYGRNYLLPKGLAEISSPAKIAMIEALKKRKRMELDKKKAEVKLLEEKLSHTSCTIAVQAGEDDKLYGAVTTADIAKVLAEGGIDIPKKNIIIEIPIKKLGIYTIKVKLAPELSTVFKLWIVKE